MSKSRDPAPVAVGIKYLPSYPAPLILFKARGHEARRVLDIARKLGVPESEQPDLATVLFQLPEGSWIPENHFAVLAQLLAAVYHIGENRQRDHDDKPPRPGRQA